MKQLVRLETGVRFHVRSSEAWCAYFRSNADSLFHLPWEREPQLTDEERTAIAKSIQTFQLGESGEGRHFIRAAERYSVGTTDANYVTATRLFIAEEQRHARDLGRFMDLAGIPRIRKEWSYRVFRRLRHLAGLEVIICVLLTAEIIANVYYAALRKATRSGLLSRLCEQILKDEAMHVRFQAERLAELRRHRLRWQIFIRHALQRILFSATCLVVWTGHRKALRAGSLSLSTFWRKAHREFQSALRLMDPRSYSWDGPPMDDGRDSDRLAVGEQPESAQSGYSPSYGAGGAAGDFRRGASR